MPRFTVTVHVTFDRATDEQIRTLLETVPHALFDPMRRQLVQSKIVESEGERSARDKAVRQVTWALDDVGLRFSDYSIGANSHLLPPHDP
jgi:hypothetical protein